MKTKLLLFFFLLISPFVFSQSISVVSVIGHEAISDVFVITENETAISNANGKVFLKEEIHPNDSITFQHSSFFTLKLAYSTIVKNKYQVLLERKTISLKEFTVSANDWNEKVDELPLKITSIHRDGLSYQPGTSADLLANTGQVFVQKSQQGGGSPMFRGFAANSILLVYDGMRVNNAIFRSGNLQNIILFDSKAMESAEVLFGPGSVIYGSDALGGVIDFRTIGLDYSGDSTLLLSGVASLGFASASKEGNGHIHFGLGGEKFSSFTSFSFSQFGDLRMGVNGPDDYLRPFYQDRINNKDTLITNPNDRDQVSSGYSQINIIQKFGMKISEQFNMDLHFSFAQTTDVPRYDRLIQPSANGLKYAEWYYGPNVWFNAGVSMYSEKSSSVFDQWKLRIDYQYYEESRIDRKFNNIERSNRKEQVDGLNFNLDFNKDISQKLQVFYGAELWYNLVGSTGVIENIETNEKTATSSRYPSNSNYLNGGAYAMLSWKLTEKWVLKGGLRYSYIHMDGVFDTTYFAYPEADFVQNNQALTPSIGVIYRKSSNLRIQANVGQGFRSPNLDDVAKVFDSSPGNVVVPNTSLDAEKVWSFDLGFTWLPTNKIQLEVSGFYSLIYDVMVRDDYTFNGQDSIIYDGELSKVEAIQNLGDGWVYGVESSINWALGNSFNVIGNLVYSKGEDGNGDPLRHVTPLMTSLHLVYQSKLFRVDLNGIYNGSIDYDMLAPSEREKAYLYAKDENGDPYSPNWYVLNLQGSWFISSSVRLDLGLENILNERYRSYSSGITGAGMNVKASIVAHF
jgi:hemoglobin/transferrin/lactoferrin receptor protein